jgi:hypothetical protein
VCHSRDTCVELLAHLLKTYTAPPPRHHRHSDSAHLMLTAGSVQPRVCTTRWPPG